MFGASQLQTEELLLCAAIHFLWMLDATSYCYRTAPLHTLVRGDGGDANPKGLMCLSFAFSVASHLFHTTGR